MPLDDPVIRAVLPRSRSSGGKGFKELLECLILLHALMLGARADHGLAEIHGIIA
ncbi:hypothetical protein ACFRNT_31840 [Streptomyces sp. NPDC056697]|uniref:hypothetical protein n=1 Tax=Streptomyces sp. NPDC056697 TaxID=3345915 RepID=UPI003679ECD0